MDDGVSTSSAQPTQKNNYNIISTTIQDVDPYILKYFLQTCMKFLRNHKSIEGLQELIDSCAFK